MHNASRKKLDTLVHYRENLKGPDDNELFLDANEFGKYIFGLGKKIIVARWIKGWRRKKNKRKIFVLKIVFLIRKS